MNKGSNQELHCSQIFGCQNLRLLTCQSLKYKLRREMINKEYFGYLSSWHWKDFSEMFWPDQHHWEGDILPQFLLKLFGHNWGGLFPLFSRCGQITREVNIPQTITYSPPFFCVTSHMIRLTNSLWTSIITLMRSDWLPLLIDKEKWAFWMWF